MQRFMDNQRLNLKAWRGRLILEEQWMYTAWSHICFVLGYALFLWTFWESRTPTQNRLNHNTVVNACLKGEGLYTESAMLTIWNTTSEKVFVTPQTALISVLEIARSCTIGSISYSPAIPWRHLTILSLFGFQALLDISFHFFPKIIFNLFPTFRYRHSTSFLKKAILVIFSATASALIALDYARNIAPGNGLSDHVHEAISLTLDGNSTGVALLRKLISGENRRKELWAICSLIGLFRYTLVLGAHPRLSLLTSTIEAGLIEIFSFLSIVVIIYVVFGISGYILFSEELTEFRSLPTALWTQYNMLLSQWPFESLFTSGNQPAVYFYTVSFGLILAFAVLRVYLAIILEAFQVTHDEISNDKTHCAVMKDVWLMCVRAYFRIKEDWPTRSQVIKYIETCATDGSGIPKNYEIIMRFYTRQMPQLFEVVDRDQIGYYEVARQYVELESTVATQIQNDPYIAELKDFRKVLQRIQRVLNRKRPHAIPDAIQTSTVAPPLVFARSGYN